MGTPVDSIEMRMSIIHRTVDRHGLLSGVNLRMADGHIVSSRRMLVRDGFRIEIRRDLLTGAHLKDRIAGYFFEPEKGEPVHEKKVGRHWVYPTRDDCGVDFAAIVAYLYDERTVTASRPPNIVVSRSTDVG